MEDKDSRLGSFNKSLKSLKTSIIVFCLSCIYSQYVVADDYIVNAPGDWLEPGAGSLAQALKEANNNSNLNFSTDIDFSEAINWQNNNGYTIIRTENSDINLLFNLENVKLFGSHLAFETGTGAMTVANGMLGSSDKHISIGVDDRGEVILDHVSLIADELHVGGVGQGLLTLNGGSTGTVKTLNVTNGDVSLLGTGDELSVADITTLGKGGNLEFNSGSTGNLNDLNIIDGGSILLSNGSINVTGSMFIDGVNAVENTPGSFTYDRSTISGNGILNFTGNNITITNGALVDLSPFWTATTVNTGQILEVSGIFSNTISSNNTDSFQTELQLGGDLNALGGVINIIDGAIVNGIDNINVENGSTITVSGVVEDTKTTNQYQSELVADGSLTVGTNNGEGIVVIANGGKIGGITDITLGVGSKGSLTINGENNTTDNLSELDGSGHLIVGEGTIALLNVINGGKLTGVTNVTVGKEAGAINSSIILDGVSKGNESSTITNSGNLVVAENANAALSITNGAKFISKDTAIFGKNTGTTATLALDGYGKSQDLLSSLTVLSDLVLGEFGNAVVTVNSGGALLTNSAILAKEVGSTADVTFTGNKTADSRWTIANGADSGLAKGNSNLTVMGGYFDVLGTLSMGGQNATYGNAIFSGLYAELYMDGGTFRNVGYDNAGVANQIGMTIITNDAKLSGSGYLYAGNQVQIENAMISPGSRWLYDFDKSAEGGNSLTSLGSLYIEDAAGVDTIFNNVTFQTQLDRGDYTNIANPNGKSDRVTIIGDLDIQNSSFNIDISRILNGTYRLVETVGGVIKNYDVQSLDQLGTHALDINLKGKPLKGNDRLDFAGGIYTTLDAGNTQLNLHIDSSTAGNVITHWTGKADNGGGNYIWDMISKNFYAAETANTEQFLDGDIVIFDDEWMKLNTDPLIQAGSRVVDITNQSIYDKSVIVPEVRVFDNGAAGEDIFTWNGGSIISYDSALYTTLDLGQINGINPYKPSGQLVKVGEGTLVINNSNQFFGGVHLGGTSPYGTGITGGVIDVNNDLAFGSYSSSDFLHKGVVFVHEDSRLNFGSDRNVNNRFIVDAGKKLTIDFDNNFTIANNNAAKDVGSRQVNGGKGGGIFIGDSAKVVNEGTNSMIITNNQAIEGGGIYSMYGYILGGSMDVKNNVAHQKGGGIYANKAFELPNHSIIEGNASYGSGGGIYLDYVDSLNNNDLFVLNGTNTITGNLAGSSFGGGIYAEGGRIINLSTEVGYNLLGDAIGGGDIWFEGNYSNVKFDAHNPSDLTMADYSRATRNALHLAYDQTISKGAILNITGPYNTYFYDPISGDTHTEVNITGIASNKGNINDPDVTMELGHGLDDTQYGTAIFQGNSAFYGDTTVFEHATFRLEQGKDQNNPFPIYGSFGSEATANPVRNLFDLQAGANLEGRGTIFANDIKLDGNISLDRGYLSKDEAQQGKGELIINDVHNENIGVLYLIGTVNIADTASWRLNLLNDNAGLIANDYIEVSAKTNFSGTNAGEKLTLTVDNLIRGRYTILKSNRPIEGYNGNTNRSDAKVFIDQFPNLDFSQSGLDGTSDPLLGRVKANTYTDADRRNLYLNITGRNRHITSSSGGTWRHNSNWTFVGETPTDANPGGTVIWSKNDVNSPETDLFLNGDMVTLTGSGTYTMGNSVKLVDFFVDSTDDINIEGRSVSTYSSSREDQKSTTIFSQQALDNDATLVNDYGIAGYTGKLYKYDSGTLSFTNNANTFAEGIVVGKTNQDGGVISFSDGNQLGVGADAAIVFDGSGQLRATNNTLLETPIQIANGKVATIDTNSQTLTVSGNITDKVSQTGGGLAKIGANTLTLSGQNTFTEGTTLIDGKIILANNAALGLYTGIGQSGVINITGNDTSISNDSTARSIKNRVILANNLNNVSLATGGADLTIQGETVDDILIQIGNGSTLNLDTANDLFINGGIDGSGTINKNLSGITQITADSAFSGISNLNAGMLHIAKESVFGDGTAGSIINLNTNAELSGNGIIQAETIQVNGTLSSDSATFSSGNNVLDNSNKYGTLTLNGNVKLDDFTFKYDADPAGLESINPNAASNWTGDLLAITGTTDVALKKGRIDLQGTISSGHYLVVDSAQTIALDSGKVLDGLNYTNGILDVSYIGQALLEPVNSPRGTYGLEFSKNSSGIDDAQIWLTIDRNSLTMDWTATGTTKDWNSKNWVSKQKSETGLFETIFNNGDYVTFTNNSGALETINLATDVMTSGFELTGNDNFTFVGTGGIRVVDEIETGIEGYYLDDGVSMSIGTPIITVDGQLQKSGSGTLMFANDGQNQFEGGISLAGGTIAFNQADQLGTLNKNQTVDKGINFVETATLFANDNIKDLSNAITISTGKVANLGVAADKNAIFSGQISEVGGAGSSEVNKVGAGRLLLTGNDNLHSGVSTVSEGILAITNAGAVGKSSSILIKNGATFELAYTTEGAFSKLIDGYGGVLKSSQETVVLDNANTYLGGTVIESGLLALQHTSSDTFDAAGSGSIEIKNDGTLRLDSGGLFNNPLSGTGRLIVNSNVNIEQNNAPHTGDIIINDDKTLTFSHINDVVMVNNFSGGGHFTKDSNQELTLKGTTRWLGNTTLDHGNLILDGSLGGAKLVSTLTGRENTQFSVINGASFTGSINANGGNAPNVIIGSGPAYWEMTESSTVNQLTLDGTLSFSAPNIANFSLKNTKANQPSNKFKTINIATTLSGNGEIHLNTDLGALQGDKIITNEASGNHLVYVTNQGIAPTGAGQSLEVIEINDPSKAQANFMLVDDMVDVGAYRYFLGQGSSLSDIPEAQVQNWYLYNINDGSAKVFSALNKLLQTSLLTNKYVLRTSLSNLSERLGELHDYSTQLSEGVNNNIWIRFNGKRYDSKYIIGGDIDQRINSVEMGLDRLFEITHGNFYLGGLVGFTNSNLSHPIEGKIDSDSTQVGLYGTWIFDPGTYVDLVGRYFWLKDDYTFGNDFSPEKADNRSGVSSLDLEVGHKIDFANNWYVTPQAELSLIHTNDNDFKTTADNNISYDSTDLFVGRVGLKAGKRFVKEDHLHNIYGRIDRLEDLNSPGHVEINGERFNVPKEKRSWNVAIGYQSSTKTNHLYIEIGTGIGNADVKEKWGVNTGIRWSF